MTTLLDTVLVQVESARSELDSYAPPEVDWYSRSVETVEVMIPWLVRVGPDLKTFVEEVLNSPSLVRDTWQEIRSNVRAATPSHLLEVMDRELERELVLLDEVGGDIVSKVVERFLIDRFDQGELASNGRSDYPDLFIRSRSYDGLPKFKRNVKEFGAALKGKSRPVRVPDGLEIKTCRNRFAVDCHHAHSGLHLALLFRDPNGVVEVFDILVAYMRYDDYRITKPSTPTTTLKASFNGSNFVSVLA